VDGTYGDGCGWRAPRRCLLAQRAREPQPVLIVDRHDEPGLPRQVGAGGSGKFENHPRGSRGADMEHKYRIGQDVYYRPSIKHTAAPGTYKIRRDVAGRDGRPPVVPHQECCRDVRANR